MKRSGWATLAIVLGLVAGAAAQTAPFPDVPVGHWAAAAVQRLKDLGILSGYPDGQFHGDRTLTRYEEAAVLDKALAKVRGWVDAIPAGPQGPPGPAGPQGPAGANGRTVRSGAGAPAAVLGADGDFYIDTAAWAIYGPKAAGAWGNPTSLIGPAGTGAETGTIQGTVIGLPKLVVLRFAQGSATNVPITWGTCMTFYACREPFGAFVNGAVGDEIRIGSHQPFARVYLNLLAAGAGGNYVAEYHNGTAWAGLSGLNDGTQNLSRSGWLAFSVPSAWPLVSVESSENLHYIRLRATVAWTAKPTVRLLGVPVPSATLTFRGAAVWSTTTDASGNYPPGGGTSPALPVGAYVVDFDAPGWRSIQYLVPLQKGPTAWDIGPQGR